MKNLIIFAFISTTLFSCTKSSTPQPPTEQDFLLKSFSVSSPVDHTKTVEVFSYDQNSQLASLHIYSYDSSQQSPETDSVLIRFTQADAVTPPDVYDISFYYQGNPTPAESDHHLLFYDNQNRVILDSISVSTSVFTSMHFIYDGNGNTSIQSLIGDPQTPGSYAMNQIDTMFIPGDNLLTDIGYGTVGGDFIHLVTRTFSNAVNPIYNDLLSKSLGSLLSFNSLIDFRSKNLPDQFTNQEANFPTVTLNFVWTADSAGRVIQGIGTDANSGLVGQLYNFYY